MKRGSLVGLALPKLDLSKAPRIIEDRMGIGLSHPITSKVLYRKGSATYRVGAAQMQGKTEHSLCRALCRDLPQTASDRVFSYRINYFILLYYVMML